MDGRKEGREEEGVVNGGILIGMRGAARYSSAMATFCDITSSRVVLSLSLSLSLSNSISGLPSPPPPFSVFHLNIGRGRFTPSPFSLWALPSSSGTVGGKREEGRGERKDVVMESVLGVKRILRGPLLRLVLRGKNCRGGDEGQCMDGNGTPPTQK